MGKQLIKYGAALIGLYIAVANGSKMGVVFTKGSQGVARVTKTLQGR